VVSHRVFVCSFLLFGQTEVPVGLDRPLSLNGSVASMSNVDLQNVKHDIAAALVMCQNDH
jgi:hypothetical protein